MYAIICLALKHAHPSGVFFQAFLCENEGEKKAAAAKRDLDAKDAALAEAREQLKAHRDAVNDKHREILKTSRNDPVKVRCARNGVPSGV